MLPPPPLPPPPRRANVNPVSASLERVEQVRTQTLTWLKSFEKLIYHAPLLPSSSPRVPSVAHYDYDYDALAPAPPASTKNAIRKGGGGGGGGDLVVVIGTPTESLPVLFPRRRVRGGGGDTVVFACSFCGVAVDALAQPVVVSFNPMLPQPYVVHCFQCSLTSTPSPSLHPAK